MIRRKRASKVIWRKGSRGCGSRVRRKAERKMGRRRVRVWGEGKGNWGGEVERGKTEFFMGVMRGSY